MENKRLEAGENLLIREGLRDDDSAVRAVLESAKLSAYPAATSGNQQTDPTAVRLLVAERDREVVGVLQWRRIGPEAEILDVAVLPAQRRKRVAYRLLREWLNRMQAGGVSQVFLEVRESNDAAIALYAKLGFARSGRRANYYREPEEAAALMRLDLAG